MQTTIERNDAEATALRVFSANGFGEAAIGGTPPYALFGLEQHRRARAERTSWLADLAFTALRAVADIARRLAAGIKRERHARATYLALRNLDARMLRDLGLDRSELMSVAAELAGGVNPTRVRLASAG